MLRTFISCSLLLGLAGCSSYPPIKNVAQVDLPRFMGDWYVIANIPTFIEKTAHNAIENYSLNEDGSIATTFTFYDGGFEGEKKTYKPTGFITDTTSNAIWGMQFIWPIKADYRVMYLNDDYTQTVIGRIKRDYVWIMARTPTIPDTDYQQLLKMLADEGYDVTLIKPVPQKWN
jgi:apolipoprotein D and lipocalin family protein